MTLKGDATKICAACKYRRRKCRANCPLAPYFPPEHPNLFQNAHRLFGIRNILGILKRVDESEKPEAMRSIIYESNVRQRFPVDGCWALICNLRWQLREVNEELNLVKSQLRLYRPGQLEDDGLGTCGPMNEIPVYDLSYLPFLPATQTEAIFDPNFFHLEDNSANPFWVQNSYGDINCIQELAPSCDDLQLLYDALGESSQEKSLKDPALSIQPAVEKDLDDTAASSSLTNPNENKPGNRQ